MLYECNYWLCNDESTIVVYINYLIIKHVTTNNVVCNIVDEQLLHINVVGVVSTYLVKTTNIILHVGNINI